MYEMFWLRFALPFMALALVSVAGFWYVARRGVGFVRRARREEDEDERG